MTVDSEAIFALAAHSRSEARAFEALQGAMAAAWLDERDEYYKALTESLYIQRRAGLIETLFKWWSDVLRASSDLTLRDLPAAKKETAAVAKRFTTTEVLRRIRRLEELRENLGRNIQEALAVEVAFLKIFVA